jgi:hypothetical protein
MNTYTCVHVHKKSVLTHVCVFMCAWVNTHRYVVYIHTYIHRYTYTRMHAYNKTCMHSSREERLSIARVKNGFRKGKGGYRDMKINVVLLSYQVRERERESVCVYIYIYIYIYMWGTET